MLMFENILKGETEDDVYLLPHLLYIGVGTGGGGGGGGTGGTCPPKFSICAILTLNVLYYKFNLLHTVTPNQKVFPTPLLYKFSWQYYIWKYLEKPALTYSIPKCCIGCCLGNSAYVCIYYIDLASLTGLPRFLFFGLRSVASYNTLEAEERGSPGLIHHVSEREVDIGRRDPTAKMTHVSVVETTRLHR